MIQRAVAPVLALVVAGLIAGRGAPAAAQEPAAGDAPPKVTRLQGTVLKGRRDPLVGATVLVRPDGDPSRLWLTATGERGAFRLDDLPNGQYVVAVTRPNFTPIVKDHVVVRFPFRAVVELTMVPAAPGAEQDASVGQASGAAAAATGVVVAVSGTVVDLEQRPVADVRLRLVRVDGSHDPRSLRTEADGSFRIDDLPAGLWRVEIAGVGAIGLRKNVTLGADATMRVVMVPQPADYLPSPLELMPPERPIPPAGLSDLP